MSARDSFPLLYVNSDLPGGYYRCTSGEDGFRFLYVSQGFLSLFGYTESELKLQFDGKLLNMIHPDDRKSVLSQSKEMILGARETLSPYRVLRADGRYLYVIDQSRFTDRFGEPCFQSVLIDITEVMILRNRMRVLEKYSTECILFMRDIMDPGTLEPVVYGLQASLGMDRDTFLKHLSGRELSIVSSGGESLARLLAESGGDPARVNGLYTIRFPDGRDFRAHIRFSLIPDEAESVSCIMTLTPATV